MKRLLFVTILFGLFSVTSSFTEVNSSDDIIGEVIWEGIGCDYYIIETMQWYVLVEWYSGSLNEGDRVSGDLHSYNFIDIKNISKDNSNVRVWVEDYWSSKDDCFDWLKENKKCGFEE